MKHQYSIELPADTNAPDWTALVPLMAIIFNNCHGAEICIMQGVQEGDLMVTVITPEPFDPLAMKLACSIPPWRHDVISN